VNTTLKFHPIDFLRYICNDSYMHLWFNCRLIIILFFSVFSYSLYSQETLTYVANKDSNAFNWDKNETIVIRIGDIVSTRSEVGFYSISIRFDEEYQIMIVFKIENNDYCSIAKNFHPVNTDNFFDKDIFIDYPSDMVDRKNINEGIQLIIGDVDEMWVPDYYCSVLMGKDRNKLLEIRPLFNLMNNFISGTEYFWYNNTMADIQEGRAIFYNSVIKLGLGTHFAIKNIKKINNGYKVDCVLSILDRRYDPIDKIFPESKFWDMYDPGDALTLFLYLDGDYLNIYADGNEILLGTFVKVKREFIKQYQSLIKTNTCDLTNVIWPSRKDGSRHFTLPIEETADNIDSHESAIAQDNGEKSSLPLPLLLAIIGGVAVIAVVVIIFVREKKV